MQLLCVFEGCVGCVKWKAWSYIGRGLIRCNGCSLLISETGFS